MFEDIEKFSIANSTSPKSVGWAPPEYVEGNLVSYVNATSNGDIWSFGCTMLEVRICLFCLQASHLY